MRFHAHMHTALELKWPSSGGAVDCSRIVLQLNLFFQPTGDFSPSRMMNTPTLYPSVGFSCTLWRTWNDAKDFRWKTLFTRAHAVKADKKNHHWKQSLRGWKLMCCKSLDSESSNAVWKPNMKQRQNWQQPDAPEH